MDDIEFVAALAAVVGLFLSVGTPVLKLNSNIIKLNSNFESLQDDLNKFTEKNTESHRRLWEHNEKQDKRLNDHDRRIEALEGVKKSD